MDRGKVSSAIGVDDTRRLVRPISVRRSMLRRLDLVRRKWRRLAAATAAGLAAATLTVVALSMFGSRSSLNQSKAFPDNPPADTPPLSAKPQPGDLQQELLPDQRILALDRSAIPLPLTVGAVVEVVGLQPSVTDYEAEVIAARATVVGLGDDVVLLAMEAEPAYRASEVAAVGSLTVLGRQLPDSGG